MNPFENSHGVSFGFMLVTVDDKPKYVALHHTFRSYGLYPCEPPVVSPPEVNTSGIYVPGMDGSIDTTETLDGVVHYKNRKISTKYKLIDARTKWVTVYHDLMRILHGKKQSIILDDDAQGYYVGRLRVEKPTVDNTLGVAYFTISGDMEPYQYDYATTGEDWLWYMFRPTRDFIRRPYKAITIPYNASGYTQTIITSNFPVVPNITIVDKSEHVQSVNVAYRNIYATSLANNRTVNVEPSDTDTTAKFSDLILCDLRQREVDLTISLVGESLTDSDYVKLRIDYRTGRL